MRYTDDGALDPSFGTGGISARVPATGYVSYATGSAVAADGSVVVLGNGLP